MRNNPSQPSLRSKGRGLKEKDQAFTLVELIVVITILAILGTIAFLSFQGYSRDARDSVRISDLSNIHKQLELMIVKSSTVFIPENKVDITASGTVILYQGEMGQDTLNKLKVNNGGLDPVDQTPYTYSTTKNLKQYELMGFLENGNKVAYQAPDKSPYPNPLPKGEGTGFASLPWGKIERGIFPQANAATNLTNRFPIIKGYSIGIILDPTTNSPIQSTGTGVDIVNTNTNYKVYLDNSSSGNASGTGNIFKVQLSHVINSVGSCNSILKNGQSKGDGIYKIDPIGAGSFDVYCDMNNGGWTGLFSVEGSGTTWKFDSTEWTTPTLRGNKFIGEETTYDSYEKLKTNEIKICRGDLNHCYTMTPNSNRTLLSYYTSGDSYVDFSRCDTSVGNWCTTYSPAPIKPDNVGIDRSNLFFSSLGLNYTIGRPKYGVGINIYYLNKLGFQEDDNNIWPVFDNKGFGIGNFRQWDCAFSNVSLYSSRARSVSRPDRCVYLTPEDKMWYVLGR